MVPALSTAPGERERAGGRIVVELGARPVEVAGMEQPGEAIVGSIEGAADKSRDVRRSQEAMARQVTHDLHVVIGETEGRRLRRTAEPRPAFGLCDRSNRGIVLPARGILARP